MNADTATKKAIGSASVRNVRPKRRRQVQALLALPSTTFGIWEVGVQAWDTWNGFLWQD